MMPRDQMSHDLSYLPLIISGDTILSRRHGVGDGQLTNRVGTSYYSKIEIARVSV